MLGIIIPYLPPPAIQHSYRNQQIAANAFIDVQFKFIYILQQSTLAESPL